jgi:PhoPQ-activated pathogenicity-related protein
MHTLRSTALTVVLVAVPVLTLAESPAPPTSPEKALADYVARPDDSFHWVKRSEGDIATGKYVELILTSQKWKDIVWKHQLFLLKPASCRDDVKSAVLFITGGSWKDEYELPPSAGAKLPDAALLFALQAEKLQTPVAVLLHCPFQPIFDGKKEDQIIAYTFKNYLETGDPTWPLLLPMVKTAVRAMDATQEACKQQWGLEIESFTVSGGSKRGWTTWLTGAVDKRATALAPMVIDTLHMDKQMELQRLSFGGKPSEQIDDYTTLGLDKQFDTPRGKSLLSIVDPYRYRQSYQQPKLLILGTNDRYWPVDALNLYWDDLPGEKYVLYCPNQGHGIKDYGRVFGSLNALHQRMIHGKKLPKLKWSYTNGNSGLTLHVESDIAPSKVVLWTAAAKNRDFRESQWSSSPTEASGDKFVCNLATPTEGYSAMFAEAVFEEDSETPYYFSTNLRVLPSAEIAAGGGK